jgi:hypothetical protein
LGSAKGERRGGRQKGATNKVTRSARQKAMRYSDAAFKTLSEIMRKSTSDQARAAAAKELLDRAHGRPQASVELTGRDGAPLVPILNITVGGKKTDVIGGG